MPARKTYPITAAHAVKFERYVRKWQAILNLGDWRVTVSDIRTGSAVLAIVYKCDLEQKSVTFRLGQNSNYPVTDVLLEELAVHELLHVQLRPFKEFCMDPRSNDDDTDGAEHSVINVWERLLVHGIGKQVR